MGGRKVLSPTLFLFYKQDVCGPWLCKFGFIQQKKERKKERKKENEQERKKQTNK